MNRAIGDFSTQGILKQISDLESIAKELAEALQALSDDNVTGRFVCQNQAQADSALAKYRELVK